jgi:hypothetical protein
MSRMKVLVSILLISQILSCSKQERIPQSTKTESSEEKIQTTNNMVVAPKKKSKAVEAIDICKKLDAVSVQRLAHLFMDLKEMTIDVYPENVCTYDKMFKKLKKILMDRVQSQRLVAELKAKKRYQVSLDELRELLLKYHEALSDHDLSNCGANEEGHSDSMEIKRTYELIDKLSNC